MAEGVKLLEEAIAHDADIESVYWSAGAPVELLEAALARGVRVFELATGVMDRVADTVTPQPVMTVVRRAEHRLDAFAGSDMVVAMAGVRDPGNAGTVLRAAWAAGAAAVVVCEGSVDPFNPKTVRASAGAVFGLPVVVGGPAAEVLTALRAMGFTRLGAVVDGGADYAGVDLTGRVVVVVGNEAAGLDPATAEAVDLAVTIPMAPGAESLNVGVAAAVICFEASRQRRLASAAPAVA